MSKTEAVVAIVGIVGVSALAIVGMVTKNKEKKELESAKDSFDQEHKTYDMIDKASVDNEKLKKTEDKAIAKTIMVSASEKLEAATTLTSYKRATKDFLKLYSDLTEGTSQKVEANVAYFKSVLEKEEKIREEKALAKKESDLASLSYKHDLDKLSETRKIIEAVRPDAYTIGKIVRGISDIAKPATNNTAPATQG